MSASAGKSVVQQKLTVRTQFNVMVKVLGVAVERRLALTKASVAELQQHFSLLCQQPRPRNQQRLFDT